MMNSKVYSLVNKISAITQNYYPEQLGTLFIVNAPWTFTAAWSVIKGWLDEKTQSKIKIVSGNPFIELKKWIDEDQIPDFLGGTNITPLERDIGPWNDFEVVDGSNKDDIVGIRRINDGPNGIIFTVQDMEALPNPLLDDPQNSTNYCE